MRAWTWQERSGLSEDIHSPLPPLGDMPPAELRAYLHRMADWVADYRETIERRAILPTVHPGDVTKRLGTAPPAHSERLDEILADLDRVVMPGIVHWGHPAFLGYFGSTSNGPALLGEIAAAALNVNAMTWRTCPAATELESVVLSWIRQMIGLPDAFTGIVYDTASVALLHALAAARERAGADVRRRGLAGRTDLPVFRIYASTQAHSSAEKATITLGLGEGNVVRVAADGDFRLDVDALRAAIERDVAHGYRPLAVIATVGTTSTGSVDPVPDVAALCRAHGVWLHVDAAYGGVLGMLPERSWVMAGVDLADSVVVNPHKWLFVPLDFSTLYTRHPDLLKAVFSLTAEYLVGDARSGSMPAAAIDYMDYGLQLGRRFRALKAWMVIRAFGRDGIASRIREHCRLASLLANWIEADPLFERVAPVPMAVVCFRCRPAGMDPAGCDRVNEAIVDAVLASGAAYLTHTRLNGRVVIRAGIGNVLTTERHLAAAWECVVAEARRILGAMPESGGDAAPAQASGASRPACAGPSARGSRPAS